MLPTDPSSVTPPPIQTSLPYAAVQVPTGVVSQDAPPPEWSHVETFPLDPAKLISWLLIVTAIKIGMSAVVFAAMVAVTALRAGSNWSEILGTSICLGIGMGIYTAITLPIALIRARRSWKVCQLVLADEGLLLTQLKGPPKRINRGDVVRITDTYDSLRLHLARGHIDVSKRLLAADRIRERLAAWQEIRPGKGLLGVGAFALFSFVSAIGFTGLYIVGLQTASRTTLAACALATLVLCLAQIVVIFRNRGHRVATRVTALLLLLGPLHLGYLLFFRR